MLQNEEFHLLVCRSAIDELAALIPKGGGETFRQARQFGLDECDIIESKDIPGDAKEDEENQKRDVAENDIHKLVLESSKNSKQSNIYIVATQDQQLADTLREIPKVLLIRLTRGVLILESASSATRRACMQHERQKQSTGGGTMTEDEKQMVQQLHQNKRKIDKDVTKQQPHRKRRKAKGPNPLSCKKKKNSNKKSK